MAVSELDIRQLLSALDDAPDARAWISYDREADVLYINYRMPANADGGEEVAPDIIAHYGDSGELVGYTILNASKLAGARAE
jgi:uncharacterized protein YuzE